MDVLSSVQFLHTVYLGVSTDHTDLGLSLSAAHIRGQSQIPVVASASDQPALNEMISLLGLDNLVEELIKLRETVYVY